MCNTISTLAESKINHAETLRFLKKQGYPNCFIRQAFPTLVGLSKTILAKKLGKSRPVISQHLHMAKYRRMQELQEEIAQLLGVPRDEFFEKD